MNTNTINITVIGGGSGTFNVLYGLKTFQDAGIQEHKNLAAIVTMTDSGGTTGEIRDKYGVLPPGDLRRAVAALARNTGLVRSLFEYKFKDETGVIGGNKIGNILLTALADITGDFQSGLDEMCRMFDVEGKVIPVTLDDVHIKATFDDGTEVIGEKFIDVSEKNDFAKHDLDQNIAKLELVGKNTQLHPQAYDALINSDIVIIGPGDFYTSIVPNLLFDGMKEALELCRGKIVYISNIMTKKGETTHYELDDFIENIEKHTGKVLDFVVVNNGFISDEIVEKYKKTEGKKPVKVKDISSYGSRVFRVIERDLVNESDYVRHDPNKLAKVIVDIYRGWIK